MWVIRQGAGQEILAALALGGVEDQSRGDRAIDAEVTVPRQPIGHRPGAGRAGQALPFCWPPSTESNRDQVRGGGPAGTEGAPGLKRLPNQPLR